MLECPLLFLELQEIFIVELECNIVEFLQIKTIHTI